MGDGIGGGGEDGGELDRGRGLVSGDLARLQPRGAGEGADEDRHDDHEGRPQRGGAWNMRVACGGSASP